MSYDYRQAIVDDILTYHKEDLESKDFDDLYDDLWIADDVTGNGSGSYTFNREQAKEYVIDNFDLLAEALEEFCCDCKLSELLEKGWEYMDVTIRCYLLSECLQEAINRK